MWICWPCCTSRVRGPYPCCSRYYRCRHNDYHLVLLARKMRTDSEVVRQCEELRSQLQSTALKQPLSRMQQLAIGHTSIAGFAAFFERADQEPLGCDDTPIDWEALIDDAVAAAMALSTMGYMAQADEAWLLILRIGQMLTRDSPTCEP
ncbi:protein three rows-like [Drosophila miranda]|uniref:protein three rows-like n=1 Tax=Drosophila miranda TaxID=7229 RepID=UPI00143F34F2|nr:protein three rows-like [Drosophila miranda]